MHAESSRPWPRAAGLAAALLAVALVVVPGAQRPARAAEPATAERPADRAASAPSSDTAASAVQEAGSAVKQAVRKSGEAARKVGAVAAVGAASAASGVAATARQVYQDVKSGVKQIFGAESGASQPADKAPGK